MRIVDDNADSVQPLLARLQAVEDRFAIQDVLYRYASAIDVQDFTTLRTLFADGFRGKYGATDWIEGADEVVAWIRQATDGLLWQHHLLSVYHVEIDGDRATALTYHTSHQAHPDSSATPKTIIARYHDELIRTPTGWCISQKVMELLWRGVRAPGESGPPMSIVTPWTARSGP
jgi:SnoaL-like domain